MTASLTPLDRWATQPDGFDRTAAETVYKAIMAAPDDDTAAIYGRIIVEGLVQHALCKYGSELAKSADTLAKSRADRMRRELAREAVIKQRRGEDARPMLEQLVVLEKAGFSFTDEQRRENARQQQRDLHSGRFVRQNVKIDYDGKNKPLHQAHAAQLGVAQNLTLSGEDLSRYQQAYQQIDRLLDPLKGLGNDALLHLHLHDKNGPTRTAVLKVPELGEEHGLKERVGKGEHVHSVSVSVVPPVTAGGAAFDAMAGLGMPNAGGVAYSTMTSGAGDPVRLGQFRAEQERSFNQDEYIPSQRVFRNLESGSKLLSDSLGDAAPRKAKYALAVGEHVGRWGPEAQKVIGPSADKAAYRYRGTERNLPAGVVNALDQTRASDVPDKRWYLFHGNAKRDGSTPAAQWRPSGLLAYFHDHLPDADLNTLHLKSGAVPPSRGLVFDKNGQTVAEAVGYGDDHYLPFNLRGQSFRRLKGGEYLRTRTFGGPTTEDIYTGLLSGAKGLAVVSHNGVYTVDFAPDLKGGKRFNDNAARMVGRYGHLLDAVQSQQVTTGGIVGSRMAEIRNDADAIFPEETHPQEYKDEVTRRIAYEQKHPKLSTTQKNRAIIEFFSNELPGGRGVGDTRQSMVADYVDREASLRWTKNNEAVVRGSSSDPRSLDFYKREVGTEVTSWPLDEMGEKYAEILGVKPQLDAHLKQAAEENAGHLKPLSLNGEGYAKALVALQEEFPHYIADVQFHPWTTSQGRLDSGYVRPGHNRAAEALSGFFDRLGQQRGLRNGDGPVFADSTRWQNRNSRVVPYRPESSDEPNLGAPTRAPAAARPTAPAQAQAEELTNTEMRQQADKALFDSLKATRFSSHASFPGVAEEDQARLRGQAIGGYIADPLLVGAAPNIAELHALDFDQAYADNPEKVRATLAAAKGENEDLKWFDVPGGVADSFERGGRPAPAKVLGERASDFLADPHGEYDFGSPRYEKAMRPRAHDVTATYSVDPMVTRLVEAGDLPRDVGAHEFHRKANELLAALSTKRDSLKRREAAGERLTSREWASLDHPSEGVARALQLRRRHDEAIDREAIKPAAAVMEEAGTQTVEFPPPAAVAGESAEDWQARLDAWAKAVATYTGPADKTPSLDNGRTIDQ